MKELIEKYVGKEGTIALEGLMVDVFIKDVKITWGRERFLITPKSGQNEVWVEKVTLKKS